MEKKFRLQLKFTSDPGIALSGFDLSKTIRPWGPFLERPETFRVT